MYAKVFSQIFDSSIAENYLTRLVFTDLLTLADLNGVVDMTHEAISRRTNVPLDTVRTAIKELEEPDPKSRTPEADGRRIVRLDDHRDWGWEIVNYEKFRQTASEQQRRENTKLRTRKWRHSSDVTRGDAPVTPSGVCDAMQKQRKKHKKKEKEPALAVPAEAEKPLETSKLSSPPKKESDFAFFVAWWTAEYPKTHDGEKYVFQNAKDGSALKRILGTLTVEQLKRIADAAWKQRHLFNCKQAATIAGMCSRINDIRDELNALRKPSTASPATHSGFD